MQALMAFWLLKRVHDNSKHSYFTATEQQWQSKSENPGSQKLFTAVSSRISPCPLSHQEEESLQKGQELDEEQVIPPRPEAPQWSFSCYPGRVLLPTASPVLRESSYRLWGDFLTELLQHTSYLDVCFIHKPFSVVTESSESMDLMHIYPILHPGHEIHCKEFFIFFCLQLQERSERGRVATPLCSLAELSYHGIPGSPDPFYIRVAQVYRWKAVIS